MSKKGLSAYKAEIELLSADLIRHVKMISDVAHENKRLRQHLQYVRRYLKAASTPYKGRASLNLDVCLALKSVEAALGDDSSRADGSRE